MVFYAVVKNISLILRWPPLCNKLFHSYEKISDIGTIVYRTSFYENTKDSRSSVHAWYSGKKHVSHVYVWI